MEREGSEGNGREEEKDWRKARERDGEGLRGNDWGKGKRDLRG